MITMSAKNTYCIGIDIGTRCIYVSAAEGVDRSSSLGTITTLFNVEKRQRSIMYDAKLANNSVVLSYPIFEVKSLPVSPGTTRYGYHIHD